ncbi:MAG: dihydropteroate synthase [Flavobacteriales bacterium]
MTINCKGKLLNLDSPIVMGILNVTPDSFYDGGNLSNEDKIIAKADQMLKEGATILDIGGYSSKPGAEEVSEEEEIERVVPAIKQIISQFPDSIISIDTFRSAVAIEAVNAGASIINDISAGDLDPHMFATVRELQVPYCIMHMQGNPKTMQENPTYENVVTDVFFSLSKKVELLKKMGVNDILIDPGFGFGKTIEHNYEILNNLNHFSLMNLPVLVGVSRKSMIYKILQNRPTEALNGTTALNSFALTKGANILRVHDVKEAQETIYLFNKLTQNETPNSLTL